MRTTLRPDSVQQCVFFRVVELKRENETHVELCMAGCRSTLVSPETNSLKTWNLVPLHTRQNFQIQKFPGIVFFLQLPRYWFLVWRAVSCSSGLLPTLMLKCFIQTVSKDGARIWFDGSTSVGYQTLKFRFAQGARGKNFCGSSPEGPGSAVRSLARQLCQFQENPLCFCSNCFTKDLKTRSRT